MVSALLEDEDEEEGGDGVCEPIVSLYGIS